MMRVPMIVLLSMLATGCASSIKVSHLDTSISPTKGVPWNLAMTQYSITITREIKSCDNALNGSVTVAATAGKTLDRDQQYALYSSGVWATSDITSTLAADGTSTGLNAHSEDQTGQVIANIATTIAKGAISMGAAPGVHFTCSDKVQKALDALHPVGKDELSDVVDKETADVAAATTVVTQLTTALGSDKANKAPLLKAYTALNAKQALLTTDQARLAAFTKLVTHVQKVDWPPKGDVAQTTAPFKLPQDVLDKWITWVVPAGQKPGTVDTAAFDVHLAIYARADDGGWAVPTVAPATADTEVGVPVRLPRVGRVVACTVKACDATLPVGWTPTDEAKLVIAPDVAVLQLGRLYTVPCAGGTFKSEACVIAIDANGIPTSAQVSEKVAAAAAATGSLASVATTAADLPGQIAAARLARTKAQADQLTAENTLAAARAGAPTAAETAAANAQLAYINAMNGVTAAQAAAPTAQATAQANAQLSYLTAANNLATAQANAQTAGPAGQAAAQTALTNQQTAQASAEALAGVTPQISALTAQTSLLNAQAAQINAQVALNKAQAALQP
ncbi:hypothetical protein [Novosphingobium sp. 9U]|uniref:hypothetical protein n=1 Tax=Novosphingobium sp. 9U TaxID=2653158 RepID=UPI0012F0991B|nr:hypothetical protein [Novosphingobium sp. 9U]VWX54423.1 conserved exported hypothetical protein [Novosphingobium sp. 9U]